MLRLRSGLGAWTDLIPEGASDTVREAAIIENVKVLQGVLAMAQTGTVDVELVAAVNKKLGTRHNAAYIRENAISLADKIAEGGGVDKWPVWKLALVGGGVLAAVFVVVKLAKGR